MSQAPKKLYYKCPRCSYYSRYKSDELAAAGSLLAGPLFFLHREQSISRDLTCLHCGNTHDLSKKFFESPPVNVVSEGDNSAHVPVKRRSHSWLRLLVFLGALIAVALLASFFVPK